MRNTVDDIEVLDEGSAVRNIDELCSAADTENRNDTVSENGLCVFAHLELKRAVRERRRCAQQVTSSASAVRPINGFTVYTSRAGRSLVQ